MKTNGKIDDYFKTLPEWQRAVCEEVRSLIHQAAPDIHEEIKKAASKNAAKGATALVVYNSSNKVDNILFNRFDTSAALSIPVVYVYFRIC